MNHWLKRFCILLALVVVINCRTVKNAKKVAIVKITTNTPPAAPTPAPAPVQAPAAADDESKQLFLGASGKETSTPNFVRLVVMRLVYGLASSMGIEERLENAFNGVFVPPNADEGVFNLGDLGGGGGGDDDGIFGDVGDIGDIFDY